MAMATSSSASLPIVDLKKAKDPAQRLAVAKQLVEALETVGFLFVDNVEGCDCGRLLNSAQWFFNLTQQEKHRLARKLWNPQSQNHYRGYFPLQPGETSYKEGFEIGQRVAETDNINIPPFFTESNLWPDGVEGAERFRDDMPGETSYKEGFEIGQRVSETDNINIPPFFTESNLWPDGMEGAERFRDDMVKYYGVMLECGMEILRLVSLGWGLHEDWFQSMFSPNSLSTLRLLHYPPRAEVPDEARDGDSVLSCSDHSDSGFVTLLATFSYAGLQIFQDGKWMAVPARPNSVVMNIGDMLSAMSGGKFKATRHRVIDTRVDRFSVPFFFEPHYAADITRVMPRPQEQVPSPVKLQVQPARQAYGPYLMEKMRSFAEYREMLNSFTPRPSLQA